MEVRQRLDRHSCPQPFAAGVQSKTLAFGDEARLTLKTFQRFGKQRKLTSSG